LSLAGLLARPSTKRSSRLSACSRAISGGASRFRIFSSTADLSLRTLDAGARLRAVERVGRSDDLGDRRAFLRRDAWAPHVADENDAGLVAVVPGLVLDRVVEHPGLAAAPLPGLAADPEAAARRHDQRQVHDQTEVCDARVRRDARVRLEHREQCRWRA